VVEAILNLPENTHIAVRFTSILLLGELCEWIDRHPQSLGKLDHRRFAYERMNEYYVNSFYYFRTSVKFPLSMFKSKGFRTCCLGCTLMHMYSMSITYGITLFWTFANNTFSQ